MPYDIRTLTITRGTSVPVQLSSDDPQLPYAYNLHLFHQVWLGPLLHPVQATLVNGLYNNAAQGPNPTETNSAPPSHNLLAQSTN